MERIVPSNLPDPPCGTFGEQMENPQMMCPASMCPLIAPNGSPWSGEFEAKCPGHDDLEKDGCPWWGMSCQGGNHQEVVEEAARAGGYAVVLGPRQPKRGGIQNPRSYDCPKASTCRWQEQATLSGRELCPPRDALARGMDPRVCLF